MKDTVRFGEYTLSGGILWLLFSSFITLVVLLNGDGFTLTGAVELWTGWFQPLININKNSSINTLLVAVVVVLLFLTGLLLDLLSQHYFSLLETIYFRHWIIKEHRSWMDDLIAKHPKFIQQDYLKFLEEPAFDWRRPTTQRCKQCYRYNKLRAFMTSYILVNAGSSSHSELMNQLNLWRTSRAISMSMMLFCTLLFIVNLVEGSQWQIFVSSILVPAFLLTSSLAISKSMFSRMCMNIFALLYAVEREKS